MRHKIGTLALWLLCGLAVVRPFAASAQQVAVEDAATASFTEAVADELQPGEYRWNPASAPEGPIAILVSIQRQIGYVYRSGRLIGVTTVSTGKAGHDTPTGVFTILQKKVDHRSNLYNNARMPFMQRLTWDGIAIHAGAIPGHPASHGCVRVPAAFAPLLYSATQLGVEVTIQDEDVIATPLDVATAEPRPVEAVAGSGVRLAAYAPGASR